MANYQGLDCIMKEMTLIEEFTNNSRELDALYTFVFIIEKFVRTAVPQLIADYFEQYQEKFRVDFETTLNGNKINQGEIVEAVASMLQDAIKKSDIHITI